jgi:type 1 glutamine amidotransferase
LVFHKTAGFRHQSIGAGIDALADLGDENGFSVTATDDAAVFTDEDLAGFEVIVFLNTTGDVLDEAQQGAMERFIAQDRGFVGIHSATDTEYEWAWYGQLVGAYFENHPAPQAATVHVTAPDHPVMRDIPTRFERFDEWYNFTAVPEGAEILATLDESSYEGGKMGDPHPIVWAQELDGARSLYTGFGHTEEAFSEELVLDHLGDGIRWAAGRVTG